MSFEVTDVRWWYPDEEHLQCYEGVGRLKDVVAFKVSCKGILGAVPALVVVDGGGGGYELAQEICRLLKQEPDVEKLREQVRNLTNGNQELTKRLAAIQDTLGAGKSVACDGGDSCACWCHSKAAPCVRCKPWPGP